MKDEVIEEHIATLQLAIKSLGKELKKAIARVVLCEEELKLIVGSKGYLDSPSERAYLDNDGGKVDPEV